MGRNPWVSGTSYPKGAKAWYIDSSDSSNTGEYVSTIDNNTNTPGDSSNTWIKLNDLSGTSGGGSTVTCGWDATKIGNIIDSLSSITSSIEDLDVDISNITTEIYNLKIAISSIEQNTSDSGILLFDTTKYAYEQLTDTIRCDSSSSTGSVVLTASHRPYKVLSIPQSSSTQVFQTYTTATGYGIYYYSGSNLPSPWMKTTNITVKGEFYTSSGSPETGKSATVKVLIMYKNES